MRENSKGEAQSQLQVVDIKVTLVENERRVNVSG